jgi:TrmH family RNA methyltransferase
MITSPANPKAKFVRRLQADRRFREREKSFVIEGTRWLTELIEARRAPELVLYTQAWVQSADHAELLEKLQAQALPVSEPVMATMSDTESAPGVLAIVALPSIPLPSEPTLLLVVDKVSNPGNLGAILRSAAAAGADGVLLSPSCVDAFNPKVIRGGMGAQLRIPVLPLSWNEIAARISRLTAWLAAADGDLEYSAIDWCRPSALVIGGEARGASARARALTDRRVTIPMQKGTESLNAAVAASVILFEAARQRRAHLKR